MNTPGDMNAQPTEDLRATRLQSMLEELGPSWTLAELQALLADLDCDADAVLARGGGWQPQRGGH